MSTSAKTLTPEQQNALAKFQVFAGQRAASTPQTQGIASLDTQLNPFLQNIQSSVGTYIDPIENKDYTDRLAPYLAKQLTNLGITDFEQVEKRIIKGDPIQVIDTGEGSYQIDGTPDVTKYYNKTTGKEIDPILFDDKAGTKYVLTDQGVQKQFDPTAKFAAQLRPYIDPSSTGGAWGTKAGKKSGPGFGPEGMMQQIASRLRNTTGVDDINDFELKTVTKPRGVTVQSDGSGRFYLPESNGVGINRYLTDEEAKTIRSEEYVYGDGMSGTTFYADVVLPTKGIYNKKTGQLITEGDTISLDKWGEGPGVTYANMIFDDKGKPKISTYGKDTSDMGTIAPLLAIAVAFGAPYLLSGIIGTAGAGTAALANTANAAAALGGASTAALVPSGLAGIFANAGLSTAAANALAAGAVHGTFQGGLSSLAGGKFSKGFASGFVGGAAPVVAGPITQTLTKAGLSPELAKIVTNSGIGGLSAAAGGKNVGQGILGSALNTGIGIGMDKAGITQLPAPVRGVVTEGISSAIRGKPFDLASAAQNAALNYGLNQTIGPQGMKAVNTFLSYKNMIDNLGRVKASPSNAIAAFNAFKAQRR